MDIKEYYIRQIGRTHYKKYENYVITRLLAQLNDSEVKFVTQQAVKFPSGKRALTDLYFPQIDLHIEIDEGFHKRRQEKDIEREADIVSVTAHDIRRVDATTNLPDLHAQINVILGDILSLIKERKEAGTFVPWDINKEFDPATYIEKGYIDLAEKVAFRTIADACNCFGHSYAGYQKAKAEHLYDDSVFLWFPKLYENGMWDNQISDDETVITAYKKGTPKGPIDGKWFEDQRFSRDRMVFAHAKDALGKVLYRFKGVFRFDESESQKTGIHTYKRITTRVKTYPPISA